MVRVPLEITVTRPDTIPWPPRPVPTVHRPDLRFLLPGVAGALVLVLPPVLGTTSVEGPRIALGVAVAAIGTVASLRTSSVPSAEDQRDWRGTVASVREENAGRRARAPMIVRAGRPQRIEAGAR
jgi:hypothetical protein